MKKIRLLLITVVALILLLALSSCGTSSAKGVYRRIGNATGRLDSYRADTTVTVSVNIDGRLTSVSGIGSEILYNISSDDCYIYSSNDTYTTVGNNVTSSSRTKSYYNGYAFCYSASGGASQSLCSPISRKDYLEYYQHSNSTSAASFLFDCESHVCSQNDNGGWEITLSGYSTESVNAYLTAMGISPNTIDDKPIDMEFSMKANSKFIATVMRMKIIFEDNRNMAQEPQIESVTYYSEYNEVIPETEYLSPDYYREVADLRVIDGIEYMISDLQSKKSDRFMYSVTQSNGYAKYTETNVVRYGTRFGKFYYDIDADINGEKRLIEYRDGKKTTTPKDGNSKSEKQTDEEAKDFIKSMIGATNYIAMYVDDIELLEDGRYKLTLDITNVQAYRDLVTSSGGIYTGATQTVYVTIKRESIEFIESEITLNHTRGKLIVTTVLDF